MEEETFETYEVEEYVENDTISAGDFIDSVLSNIGDSLGVDIGYGDEE